MDRALPGVAPHASQNPWATVGRLRSTRGGKDVLAIRYCSQIQYPVPAIHQPRRPRASPLWQIVHHCWDEFLDGYEEHHREEHGPLAPHAADTVRAFHRCGDLSAGFTRLQCPDCGHEKLVAFTCKGRHFCPACHMRRVRTTGTWIASAVCREVPHRQFVFTIPRMLRGIFRKRRHLLALLFQTAIDTLRDAFRARLGLPDGRLAAIAAVHTFGDYLVFHPHLHVLAACGLFDREGAFHCLPDESPAPIIELFRHRFLQALREAKLISPRRLADLLSWQHSGFHIDAGAEPVAPGDTEGRKRLAEYLLRHPFSLQKITWNATTRTVIYQSRRSWRTKRNFEIFTATDFLAAAIDHIPPKGQQTVRYYGAYSNKCRGMAGTLPASLVPAPPASSNQQSEISNHQSEILLIPAPPKQTARAMRPLWRDLILQVWGGDPLECPCCHRTMKPLRQFIRPEEIEFFLRLHGLWEGVIDIPPPPAPPFDIESFEPVEPAWQAIREWIPDDDPDDTAWFDQSPAWKAPEVRLDDDRILVLE